MQFFRFQRLQEQSGNKNLYTAALEPFKKSDSTFVYPRDYFDTEKYFYVYDRLVTPGFGIRSADEAFVLFPNIDILQLKGKCYQVHVFAFDSSKLEPDFEAMQSVADFVDDPSYCGMAAVFNKDDSCPGCAEKTSLNLFINISSFVNKTQISKDKIELKVLCLETSSPELPIVDLRETALPSPMIVGIDQSQSTENENEESPTEPDSTTPPNLLKMKSMSNAIGEEKILVWVGAHPPQLERAQVEKAVSDVISNFGYVLSLLGGFKFELVKDLSSEVLVIRWAEKLNLEKVKDLPFGGKELVIGTLADKEIVLDITEQWYVGEDTGSDGTNLGSALCRMVGHLLGLKNGYVNNDLMALNSERTKFALINTSRIED